MKIKNLFFLLSVALLGFASCSSDDDKKDEPKEPVSANVSEAYIDATSRTNWNYYSLANNKLVGTGEENAEDNAAWAKRTDWDFAVNKYSVRTNSGASTSAEAQGGVYICEPTVTFESLTEVPENAPFAVDKAVTSQGMLGVSVTTVKSNATVINFKTNGDGSLVMPPVYEKAPVYIFKSADGAKKYKVEFTQYLNDESVSGHVKFHFSEI